ncbi:hypothetical protein [Paraburkholderia sp. BL21I4N1]|uniref:hypothetical protein n=1 Tax=Paraburkholderia sp. BL21I4N1 TaxID=1938801 RepID=UPI000CFAE4C4|nr:hypothetical protein [Paraburkholderia sp. BL21I4N1]PQV52458.1 hypothetical protein B0G83_103207 [Paraburkholderia sp. BL21I4N1]
MKIKTYILVTLVVFSSAAFGWQPLVYPIRSQSPYQRSIDTATCYAAANKQTKINIAHESQIPPRHPAVNKTSSTGVPSRPPLPPSSFSATPPGIGMPASTLGASAPVAAAAAGASGAKAGNAANPASSANATAATSASNATAMAANPASATSADNGASATAAASATEVAAASGVKLPPLPAPEPPMTQYWAAYGACMQARGYVVTQ